MQNIKKTKCTYIWMSRHRKRIINKLNLGNLEITRLVTPRVCIAALVAGADFIRLLFWPSTWKTITEISMFERWISFIYFSNIKPKFGLYIPNELNAGEFLPLVFASSGLKMKEISLLFTRDTCSQIKIIFIR